jgi:DNA processing protein
MVTAAGSGTAEIEAAAAVLAAAEGQLDGWLPLERAGTQPAVDHLSVSRAWSGRLNQLVRGCPGVRAVLAGGELYPPNLATAPGRPAVLFIDGQLTDQDRQAIAVVGSRAGNDGALTATFSVATTLAKLGFTIVSGLARGVDTAAHEGALAGGGRTIAVMGTGIGAVFPPENAGLSDRIKTHGALVSQFPPGYGPTKTTFPARNAVIAGMSLASLIMTASERSGTRIELDYTLALSRPVLLWRPLLEQERWARQLAQHPLVNFVSSAEDVAQAVNTSTFA